MSARLWGGTLGNTLFCMLILFVLAASLEENHAHYPRDAVGSAMHGFDQGQQTWNGEAGLWECTTHSHHRDGQCGSPSKRNIQDALVARSVEIQLGEAPQAEHGAAGRTVLNYQVQLRTEQRKCPNSDLACPPISAGPTRKPVSNKPMVLQHPKDFENCMSEGGPWNCARCREANGTGGALPCDVPNPKSRYLYSQCPDDLHAGRFFNHGGGCASFGHDPKFTGTVRNGLFPYEGNKWNKWSSSGIKVSTKFTVGHAQYSHPTEGFIMFKRVVFHKSGNTTKADVHKVLHLWATAVVCLLMCDIFR